MASRRKTSTSKKKTRKTSRKTSASKTSARKTSTRKKGSRKKGSRRYGAKASKKVERSMHEMKEGSLRSGRSGKRVTNPKQAIAIGLSEARSEGGKVPRKKRSSKRGGGRGRRSTKSS